MITIENKRNIIYKFGRHQNGDTYVNIDRNFKPYFYYKDWKGKYRTIEGDKASKIICKTPKELKEKKEKYTETYEADVRYVNRYIIDTYEKIEKEPIKVCYFDIEIKKTNKGYESPEKATNPILSIACFDNFSKKYKIFYERESTEKDMLNKFIDYIQDTNPDILVAWNGDRFDFPFIINRIMKLGINVNRLARENGSAYTTKYSAKIFGRVLIDFMEAYKRHFSAEGRESWSLEYISRYELEDKGGKEVYKGELDDLYKNNINKFLEYNKRDVELLYLLDEKLNIINFFDEIRRLCFCTFDDILMNTKLGDCLCLKYSKNNKFVLPSIKNNERNYYEGGFVHNSTPKLHRNVAVVDFKSLYPSIIIGFNMSFETYKDKDNGNCFNIDDKYFFTRNKGIIPNIVKPLLDERVKVKTQMKDYKFDSDDYKRLDMKQYALKVIANSFYGILAFPNFRLYKGKVAEAITYTARKLIKMTINWFKENGYEVIYGDTDSVFISFGNRTINTVIKDNQRANKYFVEYLNSKGVKKEDNIVELELEKIFKTIFFKRKIDGKGAKKKYAGRLIWANGDIDRLNIIGFESRRSDNPTVGRELLKNVLNMIVYEKPKEEIEKYVDEFKNKIKFGIFTPEEIGIPMGISKPLEQYGNQIHIRASRVANEKHKANIKQGDKIKYLYVKTPERVIAFKDYMWDGYDIDYDMMIRRIVDMKIGPIFEVLEWKYKYLNILKPSKKRKKEVSFEDKLKQKGLWT